MKKAADALPATEQEHVSTLEAARMLGLAVRSVQLMVDRGELSAWKTPGGHRRITRGSVDNWKKGARPAPFQAPALRGETAFRQGTHDGQSNDDATRVLLIEDSVHFQTLVTLLVKQHFPQVSLHVASDGIAGLAMTGQYQPNVLLIDILLPGIDGATLITSLRSHPQFQEMQLIVITSLEGEQLAPYAFALEGLPVIHKPYLATELPQLLKQALARTSHRTGAMA